MESREPNWDPDVKRFFVKVLNSISMGLIWMMTMVGLGLYVGLAFTGDRPVIFSVLFYVFMIVTFYLLIRYYLRVWKKDSNGQDN